LLRSDHVACEITTLFAVTKAYHPDSNELS